MFSEILQSAAGLAIFPSVSLVLFVAIFTGVLVRVVRMDRAGTEHLANLPLDSHSETQP